MYILSIKLPLTVTTSTERFLGQSSARTANQGIQMAWAYWAVLRWWKPNTGRAHSGEASKSPHTQHIDEKQNEARAQCSYCFFKESKIWDAVILNVYSSMLLFDWKFDWKAILKQLSNLYDILRVHSNPKHQCLLAKNYCKHTHTHKKSHFYAQKFWTCCCCFKDWWWWLERSIAQGQEQMLLKNTWVWLPADGP